VLGDLSLLEPAQPQEITRQEYAAVETYRGVLRNHWLPELGTLPMSAVTRQQSKTILHGILMAGMKANMARSLFGVLRTCLKAAIEEERIVGNLARSICRNRYGTYWAATCIPSRSP